MSKTAFSARLPKFWPAAAGVGAVALLLFLLSVPGGKPALAAGQPAPDFEMTDLAGRPTTLADYSGKVLLVDFWATWCLTCEKEVPDLKALHKKFENKGFALLAASVDEGAPGAVAQFASERRLPWRVVFATKKAVKNYDVYGLPAKFLIDQRGRFQKSYQPDTPISEIEKDIEKLLSGGGLG